MPKVWAADDEYDIIRELLDGQHRQGRALAAAQMPQPAKDRLVITTNGQPATWQLSAIPATSALGSSVNLSLNGQELDEATDYSIDYTTGLVTFSAGQQALFKLTPSPADVLTADYWTTGDLIAASGPADVGALIDTFNRADSSSTVNPASDGGTWYVPAVITAGIQGNAGIIVAVNPAGYAPICRDLGQASCDVSWTVKRNATLNGDTMLSFGMDQIASIGGYRIQSNGKASGAGNSQPTLLNIATSTSWNLVGGTDWTSGAATTFRATFDASTGAVSVWQDGVLLLSITDAGHPTNPACTWVGWYDGADVTQTGLLIDSFIATPV